jgi:hypothetical protein
MTLVKTFQTTTHTIKIYSLNPALEIAEDAAAFEGRDVAQLQNLIFNVIGAEEFSIGAVDGDEQTEQRYSII